ncbi:MAG: hypothetical protein QXT06_04740 [Candidatus Bathyarchaeia archaeon]
MKIRGKTVLPLDELLTYALVILGVAIACIIMLYAISRRGGRGTEAPHLEAHENLEKPISPFKVVKTISESEAKKAREELRILDLEREILSDAIRKLYEAHAEGKITEEERERLAQAYKERMKSVKEAIERDESVVALHELETMQEDLVKLFNERFEEINAKINELRSKILAAPIKEVKPPAARAASGPLDKEVREEKEAKKTVKRKRKMPEEEAKPVKLSEAEKRIEEIRAEIEKVLERLGQMEIET